MRAARTSALVLLVAALAGEAVAEKQAPAAIARGEGTYAPLKNVHGGAGTLRYRALFEGDDFNSNVLFVHRGVLEPKSGIGHHFHNQMEEMYE